jgi:hypothetical protein
MNTFFVVLSNGKEWLILGKSVESVTANVNKMIELSEHMYAHVKIDYIEQV